MERAMRIEKVLILIGLAVLLPWPFVAKGLGHTPGWYRIALCADLAVMLVIAYRRWMRVRDLWR
jgi:hypothetical protein